jgi:thymidylate synthase (FAD)
LARANLPVSLYTEWYWQIDLHNLFHFLHLRLDAHAQYEIRVFGEAMARCAKAVAPMAYEAFEEHILGSVQFSRAELQAISAMMDGKPNSLEGRALGIFEDKIARMRAASPAETPEEPKLPEGTELPMSGLG